MKDTKNEKLLSKILAQAKRHAKAREKIQMNVWKEMLNQIPKLTDAWWELKRIVETAEFIKDNNSLIGDCGPEDAPMIVQMLKNLCRDYNSKNRPKTQWMASTVDGMEEYGIGTRESIRILRCALKIGILRKSRFYEGESDVWFIPSLLDEPKITHEIFDHIVKEYEAVLWECGVKRRLLNEYYPDMEIRDFSFKMKLYLQ